MKKALSVLLALCLACCAFLPLAAHAQTAVSAAYALLFHTPDGWFSYLRFDKDVVGVSDSFYVETELEGDSHTDPVPLATLDPTNIEVISGEYLQIVIVSPYDNESPDKYILHGLLCTDGKTVDLTLSYLDFSFMSGLMSAVDMDILTTERFDGNDDVYYHVGEGSKWTIDFDTKRVNEKIADEYLWQHATLTSEGVTLQKVKNNQYVLSSVGKGTVTLEICGSIRYTFPVEVVPKQEYKDYYLNDELSLKNIFAYAWEYGRIGPPLLGWIGLILLPPIQIPALFVYGVVTRIRLQLA